MIMALLELESKCVANSERFGGLYKMFNKILEMSIFKGKAAG
jgi:hypothetical protein